MKKILIPFDFTEVSINALQYAMDMSQDSDELHLVHVHSGLLSIQSPLMIRAGMDYMECIQKEIEATILKNLGINSLPENLTIVSLTGNPVHAITKYANKTLMDMAVVGTRDKYDMIDRWIGTISLGLVKRLFIPVYLIPRYASFESYNKALIASDHHLAKTPVLHQIKTWNDDYNAYIKFLHVRENISSVYNEEAEQIVRELYEKENVDFSFEISTVTSRDIGDSLLSSAYNFKADILIVIAENQSFMHSLLFKSLSKELILKSSIPVLFLHD